MTERERFEAWFMREYSSSNNELRRVNNSALLTEQAMPCLLGGEFGGVNDE